MAELGPDQLPSPWVPETNPQRLKVLGKLGEELNECGSAQNRCVIQGIDETEPVTGKVNRRWLEEEIADVLATSELTIAHFGLDRAFIASRRARKLGYLGRWLDMLGERERGPCVSCGLNTAVDPGHALGCPEASA